MPELQRDLPPLQEKTDFTRAAPPLDETAQFSYREFSTVDATPLPSLKDVRSFWDLSKEVIALPTPKKSTSADTIAFDDEPVLKQPTEAAALFADALRLLVSIDRRFFPSAPQQSTKFEVISAKSDAARELFDITSASLRLVTKHFVAPAETVLKRFLNAVRHHQEHPELAIVTSLDQATYLAALDMVYDAGKRPNLVKPNPKDFLDSEPESKAAAVDPKSPAGELARLREKKKAPLNYGTPRKDASVGADAPQAAGDEYDPVTANAALEQEEPLPPRQYAPNRGNSWVKIRFRNGTHFTIARESRSNRTSSSDR